MRPEIPVAVANLDAWLETMRQAGGYGGPVVHWWRHCLAYTGPGLDWRYEGLLIGYAALYEKTGDPTWRARVETAARDLVEGQGSDGSLAASRFEMNPGSAGTPHEAAASLGLLHAAKHLQDSEAAIATAVRCLQNLVTLLWDGSGFNDRPGSHERVPNKLATLAEALMLAAEITGDESYLVRARACLDDVVRYQVTEGSAHGAIHQYAPGAGQGDGRFFPYYNARCIPALATGQRVFEEPRYADAADQALAFLRSVMNEDGSWPQVVYSNGRRAEWPRWFAGVADILWAFHAMNAPFPDVALDRLLGSQQSSGAFPTGAGFAVQASQRSPSGRPDARDVIPVVGWNDKVLRLLAALADMVASPASVSDASLDVHVGGEPASFHETSSEIVIRSDEGEALYAWNKVAPWATVNAAALEPK